jgi:hypothetical protein
MRSGGKGMWGRGPALYKHNYLKKKNPVFYKKNQAKIYKVFLIVGSKK